MVRSLALLYFAVFFFFLRVNLGERVDGSAFCQEARMSQISLDEIITHGMTNYEWQGFDHAANCMLLLKAVDMGQNIRSGSRFSFILFFPIFLLQRNLDSDDT